MNEHKFTGKADTYAKYRPSYPHALIRYLYEEVGLGTGSAIADMGSGTGILTALLLEQGSFVYGVEPNADMRRLAEATLGGCDKFRSLPAPAEATGLPDGSVNFVIAAQSFHWFSRNLFQSECKRILKPGGKVILIWNSRDDDSELTRESEALNRRFCPEFKGFSGGLQGNGPEKFHDFFRDGVCEHRTFRNDLTFDEAGFVGRNLSASYVPETGSPQYQAYISELRQLFHRFREGDILRLPNITKSYVGEV